MKLSWERVLKVGGVILFVLGQTALLLAGVDEELITGGGHSILNQDCEEYLVDRDEFRSCPRGCKQQLKFLLKRIQHKLELIEELEK